MGRAKSRRASAAVFLIVSLTGGANYLVTPAQAAGPLVAVLDNPTYVDTGPSDNVQAALTAKGYTVRTFTDVTNSGWQRGLAGAKVLAIPRLTGDVYTAMTPEARRTLREYIASGGGLIVFGGFYDDSEHELTLVTELFGVSAPTTSVAFTNEPTTLAAGAAGTDFAGGPVLPPTGGGEIRLLNDSLSPGMVSIYSHYWEGAPYSSSVVLLGFGAGEIVYLSWPWHNAEAPSANAWNKVLDRAAQQVMGTACNITGTPGADFISGTTRADRICARSGSDTVQAGGGNDTVLAGDGGDTVSGQGGNDKLLLEAGDDKGYGEAGNDAINGGPGDDTCKQGAGTGRLVSC